MTTTTTTALATDKVVMRTEPIQRRSSERIELLLDAAAALIDDHGIDGVTTSAVARKVITWICRVVCVDNALVIAIHRANLARPGSTNDQVPRCRLLLN